MGAGRELAYATWDLLLALVVLVPLALPVVVAGVVYWLWFR